MLNPRPFLKWAGGKSRLLAQFEPLFPNDIQQFCEPFVGSGAVFFHLQRNAVAPFDALLSDENDELINCYRIVREAPEELIAQLAEHDAQHGDEYFYATRSQRPGKLDPTTRAARTIYLNKTCFNGLYRVNKRGEFNVPMGRYRSPRILDRENLLAVSQTLQNVALEVNDFRSLPEKVQTGEFIYFDPPYNPVSKTANFTSYTAHEFNDNDQRELAAVYRRLDRLGCQLMLSNSDTSLVRELYTHFRIAEVFVGRAINSRAERRGKVRELVVLNY